jgi:hypothetical protein
MTLMVPGWRAHGDLDKFYILYIAVLRKGFFERQIKLEPLLEPDSLGS